MHTKIGLLLLVMLASQITATPIFKQINSDEILILAEKSYQPDTTIGGSTFKNNSQNTFGIQLPFINDVQIGFNIDFFSLIPKNTTTKREYKIRAITPNILQNKIINPKLTQFYGVKIPVNIIAYKESGTIDKGDDEHIALGIEPLIGTSLNLYKTIFIQLKFSTLISYLPKLSHEQETNPKENIVYCLPKFSFSIIF